MKGFKDFYDDNGYSIHDGFIDKQTIDKMNETIDTLLLSITPSEISFDENNTGKIKQIQHLDTYDNIFIELVDKVRPIAQGLIGEMELDVLNVQMFEKHPQISKPTRSHQDNAYFKMYPPTPITFWVALDDIDEENGCIYYAPKTHLTPTRKHQRYHPHTTFRVRSGVPGLSLCLHEHPEETDIPIIVKKGDVLAHNSNTIHRAGANTSVARHRRAIGIVFIPKSCTTDERLMRYHTQQLKEDIELQKIKNPGLYRELIKKYPL